MTARTITGPAVLVLALMTLGCPGPAPGSAAKPPREPVRVGQKPGAAAPSGEELYKRSCAACHGADAKGIPNLGLDLVDSEFCKSRSDDELLDFVKKGRTSDDPASVTKVPMPPKGGNPALKDADIKAIVAYMRSLRTAP
ncbi:MAG: cytochrome c [Planctomycetota bacterium]|nr:cytochrome c [Planctomycetota bacterium]